MVRKRSTPPKYRLHKPCGQALVGIHGTRYYLGRHGTPQTAPESWAKHTRLLDEVWRPAAGSVEALRSDAADRSLDDDPLTVTELVVAYWEFAEVYYRRSDGSATCELANIQKAVRPLTEMYGDTAAIAFGPRKLETVRQSMIEGRPPRPGEKHGRRPWSWKSINRQIRRIKRIFKWAVSKEMLPASVYQAIETVEGLRFGRSMARETPPVKPVPLQFVEAVLPFLRPPLRALVRLQLLTGARPGELLTMRGRDIDMSGKVWLYRPAQHKTMHHGHDRKIRLGPRGQDVIGPFLKLELDAPLFSPREAVEQLRKERSEAYQLARATSGAKVSPSRDRRIAAKRVTRPKRAPAEQYTVYSYRQAIARACKRADVPSWHPHQLRHNYATELAKECGVETARILLGHSTLDATMVYAEDDERKAMEVVLRIG